MGGGDYFAPYRVSSFCLNAECESGMPSISLHGRLFQSLIVLGKKLLSKILVLVRICISFCLCPLDELLLGVGQSTAGMSTNLLRILYIIVSLLTFLLVSSVSHPCFLNSDVTVPGVVEIS